MINAIKMLDADAAAAQTITAQDAALSPPALDVAEPVTLQRAKEHLRVTAPDDDAYIAGLITAARAMAEGRLNRTIVQRRRVDRFAGWGRGLTLLKPPVLSVDGVEYVDDTGAETLLDPADYSLMPVNEDELPYVDIPYGGNPLPALARCRRDAVRIYYTAGYPVGEVPAPIIQWILLALGTMYANRESVVNGVTSVPLADDFMKWLLQPYMVYE